MAIANVELVQARHFRSAQSWNEAAPSGSFGQREARKLAAARLGMGSGIRAVGSTAYLNEPYRATKRGNNTKTQGEARQPSTRSLELPCADGDPRRLRVGYGQSCGEYSQARRKLRRGGTRYYRTTHGRLRRSQGSRKPRHAGVFATRAYPIYCHYRKRRAFADHQSSSGNES